MLSTTNQKPVFENIRHGRRTFSQFGEDLIVEQVFRDKGIEKPTYMDIGAYHPFRMSNTALFYRYGSRGVNVEANPALMRPFKIHRSKDVNLNIGVIPDATWRDKPFWVNSKHPEHFSSFIRDSSQDTPIEIRKTTISFLFYKYGVPDYLSIDTEEMDMEILVTMQDKKPKVICVETAIHHTRGGGKSTALVKHLENIGYIEHAYTGVNSIMVLKRSQ